MSETDFTGDIKIKIICDIKYVLHVFDKLRTIMSNKHSNIYYNNCLYLHCMYLSIGLFKYFEIVNLYLIRNVIFLCCVFLSFIVK